MISKTCRNVGLRVSMCADEYSGSVARYWSKCSRRLSKCLGLPCPESSVDNKRRHWPTVFCQSVLDYLQLVFVQPRRQTDKQQTEVRILQTVYFSQKCTEAIRVNLCQLKSRTATVTAYCEWREIQSGLKSKPPSFSLLREKTVVLVIFLIHS